MKERCHVREDTMHVRFLVLAKQRAYF